MLADESKYPINLGLYTVLSKGSGEPSLYAIAIIGTAVSIIPLATPPHQRHPRDAIALKLLPLCRS